VEYHVRSARLTDVDASIRILLRDEPGPDMQRDDADRLRSLLFVPAATVVVAEAERRVIGVGVLSIRPSVQAGPFVGIIDELGLPSRDEASESAESAAHDPDRGAVGSSILEHLITSARNKGCTRVEVTDPLVTAEPALLESVGFARQGALLSRAIG
jgi:hypothetical protein